MQNTVCRYLITFLHSAKLNMCLKKKNSRDLDQLSVRKRKEKRLQKAEFVFAVVVFKVTFWWSDVFVLVLGYTTHTRGPQKRTCFSSSITTVMTSQTTHEPYSIVTFSYDVCKTVKITVLDSNKLYIINHQLFILNTIMPIHLLIPFSFFSSFFFGVHSC